MPVFGNDVMTVRLLRFIFYSLVIHVVSIFFIVMWQQWEFGFGALSLDTINPNRIHSALLVTLSRSATEKKMITDSNASIDKAIDVAKDPTGDEWHSLQAPLESENISQIYRSAQLTRAPIPIDNIDLDADVVDIGSLQKKIVLTLVIGKSGLVEKIGAESEGMEQQELLERVVARFKAAQFLPGEINGRVVRSQLVIVVVEEPVTYDHREADGSTVSTGVVGAGYPSVVGE